MDLHSIEQPIRAGQLEEMAHLAAESPLPIALDEELIGCNAPDEKRRLLETIHPQYIILKPSLHGGIAGCTEWVHLAETILGSTPSDPMVGHLRSGIANRTERYRPMVRHVR